MFFWKKNKQTVIYFSLNLILRSKFSTDKNVNSTLFDVLNENACISEKLNSYLKTFSGTISLMVVSISITNGINQRIIKIQQHEYCVRTCCGCYSVKFQSFVKNFITIIRIHNQHKLFAYCCVRAAFANNIAQGCQIP